MARIFDSTCGDSIDASKLTLEWDLVGSCAVASGIPGMTGNCLQMVSAPYSGYDTYNRRNLGPYASEIICGFRMRVSRLATEGYRALFGFWDNGAIQTVAMVDSAGRITFWSAYSINASPLGSMIAQTAAGVLRPNVNLHLGLDVVSGTSGSIKVYANSQLINTFTGINTASASTNGINQISIHSGTADSSGLYSIYFDDLYVNDTSGSHSSGFDGDLQGLTFMPSAPGQYTEQSIAGSAPAATNWQSVDEIPPDDGVTAVQAATVGLRDTYKVNTMPTNVVGIVSVTTLLDARTDTAGLGAGAEVAPLVGNGTTIAVGNSVRVNTDFDYKHQYWPQNPVTSTNWNVTDWNAGIEFGHKRSL